MKFVPLLSPAFCVQIMERTTQVFPNSLRIGLFIRLAYHKICVILWCLQYDYAPSLCKKKYQLNSRQNAVLFMAWILDIWTLRYWANHSSSYHNPIKARRLQSSCNFPSGLRCLMHLYLADHHRLYVHIPQFDIIWKRICGQICYFK